MMDNAVALIELITADPQPFLLVIGLSVLAIYLVSAIVETARWRKEPRKSAEYTNDSHSHLNLIRYAEDALGPSIVLTQDEIKAWTISRRKT